MRRLCRTAFLFLACTAAPAAGQQPAPVRIDSIFAEWDRSDSPGCALGVVRDGVLVHERGYGSANLDYGLPNGPDMVYYVGSLSKQFTAAAIALLAQEGRLGLDDDVRRYLPELPDYGATLTLRHLVHHTSGLRDIYVLMGLAGLRLEDVFTDAEALALIARQRELNFPPGTAYSYSNSGYFLLGQIVARVTGQSLGAYADAKLFRPLGMTSTHFHDDARSVVRNRVVSYERDGAGFRMAHLWNFDKVGAGGLYSSIRDLAKWDANFYRPVVGGRALLELLHTRGTLHDGDTLDYAFGLVLGELHGRPVVRHSGAMMGFRADFLRLPTERTSVIALCNLASTNPGRLTDRVAALYLGETGEAASAPVATAPSPAATAIGEAHRPAAAALAAFAGAYWSEELQTEWRIELRDGRLQLTRPVLGTRSLTPLAADRFAAAGLTLHFERGASGTAPAAFLLGAGIVRNIRFVRRPPGA